MSSPPRDSRLGQLPRHDNAWQSVFHFTRPPLPQHTRPSATYRQRTTPRSPETTFRDASSETQIRNFSLRMGRRKRITRALRRPCTHYTRTSIHESFRNSPYSFRASKSVALRSARDSQDARLYWTIFQETFWILRKPYGLSSRHPCSPFPACT